jgi:hypothetical protein
MKTKTKFLKIQSIVIFAVIALLGFSCEKEGESICLYGTPPDINVPEYGTPSAVFINLGEREIIEEEDDDSN